MIGPFIIDHQKNPAGWRRVLATALAEIAAAAEQGSLMIRVDDVLRSLDQNRKQWPMLVDIAAQVPLTINGAAQLASPKDWKAVLSAVFLKETRLAVYDGTLVSVGASTSQFGRRQFSEYIEFLYSVGAEHSVEWSEKARDAYALYRPKQPRSTKA